MSPSASPPLEFHPNAPRPNLLWSARLPTSWRLIDTHPSHWKSKAKRISEDYIPGVRLKSAEQKMVYRQLENTVKAAQDAGALLTFVLPGALDDGQVSAATLVMRWQDSAPNQASLQPAKTAFPDLEMRKTESGKSLGFIKTKKRVGPLSQRQTAHTAQAFLPIPQSTWTLVISGTAPTEDLGEMVSALVIRLANGINVYTGTDGLRISELVEDEAENEQAFAFDEHHGVRSSRAAVEEGGR